MYTQNILNSLQVHLKIKLSTNKTHESINYSSDNQNY